MAVPRGKAPRSAAAAAALSFLLPGFGQAYLRHWRRALLYAVPSLLIFGLLANELAQGGTHLIGRLFDPAVGLTFLIGALLFGVWRVASVVDAWRNGRRSLMAWMLLPVLVLVIVGTHASPP